MEFVSKKALRPHRPYIVASIWFAPGLAGAEQTAYSALMTYSPMAFASRKLEAAFLRDQDTLFTAVCTYFWFLSLCTAGASHFAVSACNAHELMTDGLTVLLMCIILSDIGSYWDPPSGLSSQRNFWPLRDLLCSGLLLSLPQPAGPT